MFRSFNIWLALLFSSLITTVSPMSVSRGFCTVVTSHPESPFGWRLFGNRTQDQKPVSDVGKIEKESPAKRFTLSGDKTTTQPPKKTRE